MNLTRASVFHVNVPLKRLLPVHLDFGRNLMNLLTTAADQFMELWEISCSPSGFCQSYASLKKRFRYSCLDKYSATLAFTEEMFITLHYKSMIICVTPIEEILCNSAAGRQNTA